MAAQGGGQQGGAGQQDNTYFILWLIFGIGIVIAVIWAYFRIQLMQFFIALRFYEFTAIYFVLSHLPENIPWVGDGVSHAIAEAKASLEISKELTPDILTMDIAEAISTTAGEYLRYPLVLYLIGLIFLVLKTNVVMRLRKKYSMKSLAKQEQANWPQIRIATKNDIHSQDLEVGPWAMCMTPLQYAKKNKLVQVTFAEVVGSGFSKTQAPEFQIVLERLRAERAFSAQLGRTWQGVEAMPPHRRAIFAVLIARGCRDSKAAYDLVAQMARSAADGELDCTGADALWKKHYKTKRVQEIIERHAYEFSVFVSAILFAREDGVLASADFLWVKPIDRRLWYVLNSVGRQTPATEVGGIFSHWNNEMCLKRSLSVPHVAGAVDALQLALSEIVFVPDEKEREDLMKQRDSALAEKKEASTNAAEDGAE